MISWLVPQSPKQKRGGTSLLLTTDRDAYQLVSDSVMVLAPRGVRDLMRIGPSAGRRADGRAAEQVPDFKAIAGDASDGIPGAKASVPKAPPR